MSYVTLEQAKQIFSDDTKKVIDSKWERHWNNAKKATTFVTLNNLLNNHKRLLIEHPESNNGDKRLDIISFLEKRIEELGVL